VNITSSSSSGDMNAGNLTSVLAGILRRGVVCGAELSECSVSGGHSFSVEGRSCLLSSIPLVNLAEDPVGHMRTKHCAA
jgi:hypothetical protein